MTVITRFAPSPTGYLHIGSARTALFNWLYARHTKGKFLLRIEDTDRARSTEDAVRAIFAGLEWLGLDFDDDVVFQFARADRHREVVQELLNKGHAYYCYCTPEELEAMREEAKANGLPQGYNGMWRDRDPSLAPKDAKPVVRLKAPREGETTVHDQVQGTVKVNNSQLDDMVLLRSDGTPTYMLSVVVDDHDMGITHVIRGDDHFTNTFRQKQLYDACGWDAPIFSHIPLIHGSDGAKLSKRHGALGVEAYRDMGLLPEAMRNYLLRLGWGHKDEEIIPTARAIDLFDLPGIGKSPSRFDLVKLTSLNAYYIREKENTLLLQDLIPFSKEPIEGLFKERLLKGMDGLKQRAKTLIELAENAILYHHQPDLDEKAQKLLTEDFLALGKRIESALQDVNFDQQSLETLFRAKAEEWNIKLGDIAQFIRIALSGKTVSPSVFEVMEILGKEETLSRIERLIKAR